MLTTDALNAAVPLATVLDNRDMILLPVVGSPLEACVSATRSNTNFNLTSYTQTEGVVSATTYVPDIVNIQYIANAKDPVLQTSNHDLVMDDVVDVVTAAIREHMVFARSVVAPAVEDLVARVAKRLGENTTSSLLGMEVIVWNPPAPLLNSALEDAICKFDEVPLDSPAMNLQLPDKTGAEVVELMKSGSKGLDAQIDTWVATKGELFFSNIWSNLFQIKQAELTDRKVVTFSDWIYGGPEAADNALAIFLLSRGLVDNPLPETEMNLSAFNKTIVEFRNQSGSSLSHLYTNLSKNSKNGILIRATTKNTVTVNGDVYAKWISDGGDNDVLFGSLLNGSVVVTVNDINSKADELKQVWSHHAMLTASVERNRLFNRTKEVLLYEFIEQLRSIGDIGTLENSEKLIATFSDCLTELREDELVDLWDAALKLLCASRFVQTEARRILLGIENVKKQNPNIEVREAATISMIEYCSWWIATQFKVVVLQ